MHPDIQNYISRIIANDATLTEINLGELNLCDSDIAPLMTALANNINVARQIINLRLYSNKLKSQLDLTMLTALEFIALYDNQLTYPPILTGLISLSGLHIEHNRLIYSPTILGLESLQWLGIHNNQIKSSPIFGPGFGTVHMGGLAMNSFTTVGKIMLKRQIDTSNIDPNHNIFVANTLHAIERFNEFTADRITVESLNEHFQELSVDLQDDNNKYQHARILLMRRTELSNELIRIIFDFINVKKPPFIIDTLNVKQPFQMSFELNALKALFPDKLDIINCFESSPEFKKINAYNKDLKQLENEARTEANNMRTLFNEYKRKSNMPNFRYLRDDTLIDPTKNTMQMTVWRPSI